MNPETSRVEHGGAETLLAAETLSQNGAVVVLIESEAAPAGPEAKEAEASPEQLPAVETVVEPPRVAPIEPLDLPPQPSRHQSILDFAPIDAALGVKTAEFVVAPPQPSSAPRTSRRVTLPPRLEHARSLEHRLQGLSS